MSNLATLPEDSELRDAAIADAATRLKILQRLAELGMRLAEEVCERAIGAPYHPEPRHDPTRSFANVSRSVRLTLVLQEAMERRLIALRNGAALLAELGGGDGRLKAPAAEDDLDDDAIDDVDRDPDGSDRPQEALRERERERFDEWTPERFDEGVKVIRAGLGLAPGADEAADELTMTRGGAARRVGVLADPTPPKPRSRSWVGEGADTPKVGAPPRVRELSP